MSEREYKARRAAEPVRSSHSNAPRKNSGKKKRSRRGSPIPGLIITAAMVFVVVLFCAFLVKTQLLPIKYLVVIAIVLLVLVALVCFLVINTARVGRFRAGVIVSLVLAAMLLFASYAVAKGVSTLNNIIGGQVQVAHVGIYVRAEDPAQELGDVGDYNFGILSQLDRDNVEDTIDQMEDALGHEVTTVEYSGLTELMDALYSDEVGAIILNSAYLDVIAETEGYEDVYSQVREITSFKVETIIHTNPVVEGDEDHVFSVYLSGIDSRTGLVAKSRSDVNIIATVNTKTRQVLLLSTPRDYYVPLTISGGIPDKLTHAGIYGVDCSIGTLEMLYDIDIDYFFRVNFSGFEDIVDSLGGITVYSDYAFHSTASPGERNKEIYYSKGRNDLNGEEALYFARERKAFADGDAQRARNQMLVIKGIINKAISPEILARYTSVLAAVEGSFEMSVPYDLIAKVVRQQLDEGGGWDIVSYAVTGTGAKKVPYSMSQQAYVMIPDDASVEYAKQLMEQIHNDEIVSVP